MIKMKRISAAVIVLCMLLALAPAAAFATATASGSCGENVTWAYDSDTKTLTISGMGDMESYTEYSNAPWYSRYSDYIENVSIETGVTSIGDYAFFWCNRIASVSIPNSVRLIGSHAFDCCKALENITIPNGVESIGNAAFHSCSGLKEATIPGSVKSVGESAFSSCYYCEMDDDFNIIYSIGLEKVTIQDGVEAIGAFAFDGCKNLNDVTLPDSVTSIGDNAFQFTGLYNDDTTWRDLYIGKHLIKADDWALNRDEINDYIIKPETKTIADNAFSGCGSLKSITIPDSVLSIGNQAFNGCSDLTSIEIPGSVTSIGNRAFNGCVDLTGINVAESNTAYCSDNGVLYNKAKTEIMRFPCQKTDASFTIPNGVTSIGNGAFENCRNLTDIIIPDGVKSIGEEAFSICHGLTSVTIPDGVESIGNSAFYNCYFVEKDDKDNVTFIGGLGKVTIPNTVTSIGKNAFLDCIKLNTVCYDGSEEDWRAISKGEKYSIADSIITYCAGVKITLSDNGKIGVKPCNMAAGKTVILALYDGDKFVGMQQSSEYSETNKVITFIPTKTYTRAKVMIWNSLDGMSPECGFKIVK